MVINGPFSMAMLIYRRVGEDDNFVFAWPQIQILADLVDQIVAAWIDLLPSCHCSPCLLDLLTYDKIN